MCRTRHTIGSEVLFSIGLSAPDEYVEQYQLLSTEQCEACIVGDTCLSCHLQKMEQIVHPATMRECARLSLHHTHGMHVQPAMYVYYVILTFITFYIYKELPITPLRMQCFAMPYSPWARGRNFTYWYHLWWQRLVMIFRIGHVSAIYFDMIALSGWQLKIVMSSFIPTPKETRLD